MQIVLVPGLMSDGWIWRHQIGALSRIAPVIVANNDGCDRLRGMADRIAAATTGPIVVIGHSMGGRVAIEVAAAVPDRVCRLALIDSGAGGTTEPEIMGRRALVALARREGMAAVARQWLPPMLAPANRANEGLVAGLSEMIVRTTADIFDRQQQALIARHDRLELLTRLACPALFVVGSEDDFAPPAAHQAMANATPEGRCVVVDGAGHMLPVEAPDALTDTLVDWLGHDLARR